MEQTVPETAATIAEQIKELEAGKRWAVLLTPGCVCPRIDLRMKFAMSESGVVVYDPRKISEIDILHHIATRNLALLLGYGIDHKPQDSEITVTLRNGNGDEKRSVVTDDRNFDRVLEAQRKVMSDDDHITVDKPEKVIADRQKDLNRDSIKIVPLEGNPILAGQLKASALADNHRPLYPTHAVIKGESVIGCLCINSLPLCRLWMDSKNAKAAESIRVIQTLENHYRMNGTTVLGTIMHKDSPFYAVKERLGYNESIDERLMVKIL